MFGKIKDAITRVKFENFTIEVSKMLCIIPWHVQYEENFYRPRLNTVVAIIYFLILPAAQMIPYFASFNLPSFINHFHHYLYLLSRGVSIYFSAMVILTMNFGKKGKWLKLLRLLSKLKLKTKKNDVKTEILWIIFSQGFFVLIKLLSNHWRMTTCSWKHFIPFLYDVALEYYYFLSTMVICRYAYVVKVQYYDLKDSLKTHTKNTNNDRDLQETIRGIGKEYRHLFKITKYYNDIFGWIIFLIFSHAIIQILSSTNVILRILDGSYLTFGALVFLLSNAVLSYAEAIYIIVSCESTSLATVRLKQLCHKLQEQVKIDSAAREEFFKLAEIIITFSPKLTAANFFVIDRGTILGIINLAATYFIVIIQFYITQNDEKKFMEKNVTLSNPCFCINFNGDAT